MKEFLSESGTASLTRLASAVTIIIGLLIAITIVVMAFLKIEITYIREIIWLVGIILGFGFGGKVVQKFAEREHSNERTQT